LASGNASLKRQRKPKCFRIRDIDQKSFYLWNDSLVAGYLQGSNSELEGELQTFFSLSYYSMCSVSP
uniref:Uncharacterized protein n=1 Tax=Sphenodon punctatus TaxID=8508 RepID=A0A8D0G6M4_SPHPU